MVGKSHSKNPRSAWALSGSSLILLGLAAQVASRAFDGGFFRGLFQGATITLMLLGSVAVGRSMSGAKTPSTDSASDGWLPSRDGDHP